jgi:large subunit ribosomal protein L18e
MKSKTHIENQLKKKRNPELVNAVILAKKNPEWKRLAEILTNSTRKAKEFNLNELDSFQHETIVVPGKVLSQGEINSKKTIIALNFSEKAKEKLLKKGCKTMNIKEINIIEKKK